MNQTHTQQPAPVPTRQPWRNLVIIAVVTAIVLGVLGWLGVGWRPAVVQQEQVVGDWTIVLTHDAVIPINQTQTFTVNLRDGSGQPLDGASVYLDLQMPAHPMGSNQPLAIRSEPGTYAATTALTMDGEWAVRVVVAAGGSERSATFAVDVRP